VDVGTDEHAEEGSGLHPRENFFCAHVEVLDFALEFVLEKFADVEVDVRIFPGKNLVGKAGKKSQVKNFPQKKFDFFIKF
jgi:hypothetical protein